MTNDLQQRIRERAYEIWENEGCPEGRGAEHWEQACAEFAEARSEADAEQGIQGQATPESGLQEAASRGLAAGTDAASSAGGKRSRVKNGDSDAVTAR